MAERDVAVQRIAAAIDKEGLPWTAGPTELTGMTAAERRGYLGLIVTPAEHARLTEETRLSAATERRFGAAPVGAPAAVDWRNHNGNFVTPVKNQGGCGSCVSFCSCSTIESAVRIKLGNPSYAIDLSEGFLQFCGGGSCNGWGLTAGLDFAKATGVTDEACMPYAAPPDMSCTTSRCADWQNRLTKISDYTSHATMDARKTAVATIGPVLAGMEVWSDFFAYHSGVYVKSATATRVGPNNTPGYHCISVVGYDDAQGCWILKNSWGTGWGEGGFARVAYGQADLLIDTSWSFYSVAVALDGAWQSNVSVTQVFASRDAQNAWAYFAGIGWRRIQPGAPDAVTNLLALFTEAVVKALPVTVFIDATYVYQAYL